MAEALRRDEVHPVSLPSPAGSTSHLNAVDAAGNAITITQTLLSLWGSGMVTEGTGICLNNGMMWFDPEPGTPNSIEARKRPLANMCPALVTKDGAPVLLCGASGGRKILPAMVQIMARVALLGESLADAIAAPRLDTSTAEVVADVRFGERFRANLSRRLDRPVRLREHVLGGAPWASPVGLMRQDGEWTGGGDLFTLACVAGE